MTKEERRRRIEEIKASARETDQMIARSTVALELALTRLERSVYRLLASR